jgi:hypothetical protein
MVTRKRFKGLVRVNYHSDGQVDDTMNMSSSQIMHSTPVPLARNLPLCQCLSPSFYSHVIDTAGVEAIKMHNSF